MAEIVPLPVPQDEQARANSERHCRLFEWAAKVLADLGIAKAVEQATSVAELRGITLDVDSGEVALAIRDALYPAAGERQDHFQGLSKKALEHILNNRLRDLKRDREKVLLRRAGAERDWSDDLMLKKNEVVPNLANLILILRKAPKWEGVLAYDEFNARVVIRRRPPWGEEEVNAPWTDHHESMTRAWFQSQYKINPAVGDVGRAVQAAAKHNKFHPVRKYFEGLEWNGVRRLDTWLIDYFHAEDSPYIRAIGPRFLISAVARIYQPGCKVDTLPIFEGPQGKQKSEALRTLAVQEAWFTDRLSHVASKDAAIEVQGVLIVEIAEMEAMVRASSSAQKAFISRRRDRFRPPHGKHTISLPRQCVFAGTINPPVVGGYLKDETGARRYWPVACRGMVDRDGLEQVRDQLWAEAVLRYKASEPWWLETPELEALATAEQAARFAVDEFEQPIREWVGDRTDVSVEEVLEHGLGFPEADWTQSAKTRVAKILKRRLGFAYWRPRTQKGRKHRYHKDPEVRCFRK